IWTYNTMAIFFDGYGLTDVGTTATQRGLALIDAKEDEEELRRQLENCLEQMRTAETHGREADVTPEILADLRAALTLDFDAGQPRPIPDLCHDLVPDLDTVPVKRPLTLADLPLPAPPTQPRRRFGGHIQNPQPPARKPGRNDPCWCGSGKKYKHCHWLKERSL
ncbi:MAG: SEC-C metal-binding domain-containing protein, partial [Anaerolineae bacterium]